MSSNFNTKKVTTAEGCGAIAGIILLVILAITGMLALISIVFMWAWGAFMVPVFDLPYLDFKEAFGALVLISVLRLGVAPIGYKRTTK